MELEGHQLLPEKPATNCRVVIISCNNSRFRCNHCADRKTKIIPGLCVWTYRAVQRLILFRLCCITMCLTNITSPCFDIFILWLTNWTGSGGESNFNLLFFVIWKDINLGGGIIHYFKSGWKQNEGESRSLAAKGVARAGYHTCTKLEFILSFSEYDRKYFISALFGSCFFFPFPFFFPLLFFFLPGALVCWMNYTHKRKEQDTERCSFFFPATIM